MGLFLIPVTGIVSPLFFSPLLTAFVVQDEFVLRTLHVATHRSIPNPATLGSAKITTVVIGRLLSSAFKRGGWKVYIFKNV